MIGGTSIADHQLAGNALAAEHTGHQGGIVEADALFCLQNGIQYRQIAAFYCSGFVIVIAEGTDHIVIDGGNLIQRIGVLFDQFRSLFHNLDRRK